MTTMKAILYIILIWFSFSTNIQGQPTLAQDWEASLVKIMKGGESRFSVPHGCGLLVKGQEIGLTYLITNRHLIGNRDSLYFIMTNYDTSFSPPRLTPCEVIYPLNNEKGNPVWISHPDTLFDIAIIPLLEMDNDCIETFKVFPSEKISDFNGISEGDFVYFYGLPFMSRLKRSGESVALVRGGIVSYKAEEPTVINNTLLTYGQFLIDGFSYGGNSGSPVITSCGPDSSARLVGIVVGHVPEADIISHLAITNGKLVLDTTVVEKNTGLAIASGAHIVREMVDLAGRTFRRLIEREKKQ
jgi:hypothetical protein